MRTVSIIVPAFNEVENLRPFYERLCTTMQSCKLDWEWIIVDDHSRDETYAAASSLHALPVRSSPWTGNSW